MPLRSSRVRAHRTVSEILLVGDTALNVIQYFAYSFERPPLRRYIPSCRAPSIRDGPDSKYVVALSKNECRRDYAS